MKIIWRKLEPEEIIEEGDYWAVFNLNECELSSNSIKHQISDFVRDCWFGHKAEVFNSANPFNHIWRPHGMVNSEKRYTNTILKYEHTRPEDLVKDEELNLLKGI